MRNANFTLNDKIELFHDPKNQHISTPTALFFS